MSSAGSTENGSLSSMIDGIEVMRQVEPLALVRVQDHDPIGRNHFVLAEIGRIAGWRLLVVGSAGRVSAWLW